MQTVREDLERRKFRQRGSHNNRIVNRPETWLTIRRGEITSVDDLAILARLSSARSVMVLGDHASDAETTKVILAIVASIQSDKVTRTTPLNIVASIGDDALARRLQERIHFLSIESAEAGEPVAELIRVTPSLVRTGIEAQVARHRGLSEVYRDLLDFDEEEFYVIPAPPGRNTFGEVVDSERVVVVGIKDDSGVNMWPDWSTAIAGKSLIVMASSRTVAIDAVSRGSEVSFRNSRPAGRPMSTIPEKILVIGWNKSARNLVRSLISTSPAGSEIHVLVHAADEFDEGMRDEYPQVRLETRLDERDPLDDRNFVADFDHVIVLAHEEMNPAESDAAVLSDVLACRVHVDNSRNPDGQPTTVVAELRQRVSKNIAGVRLADDLLLSDSLKASAMTQLAVHPELLPVFRAILESDSADHVQLLSDHAQSKQNVGRPWRDVRRQIMRETGELPVAIRAEGISAGVSTNPPGDRVIHEGEEIIVFGRYVS